MARDQVYRQCELARGTGRTVGWIEERGARVGASVELEADSGALWEVLSVSDRTRTAAELRADQAANKHESIGRQR